MKKAQSLVVILGVFILGAIGYYFYISINGIQNPLPYEDSFVLDEYTTFNKDLADFENETHEIEYEFSEIESLDFEEDEFSEQDIENEIIVTQESEFDIEQEFSEIESLDF